MTANLAQRLQAQATYAQHAVRREQLRTQLEGLARLGDTSCPWSEVKADFSNYDRNAAQFLALLGILLPGVEYRQDQLAWDRATEGLGLELLTLAREGQKVRDYWSKRGHGITQILAAWTELTPQQQVLGDRALQGATMASMPLPSIPSLPPGVWKVLEHIGRVKLPNDLMVHVVGDQLELHWSVL
jgi:hypothetical protein